MSRDLTLRRDFAGAGGVVSTLIASDGTTVARTLTHAYGPSFAPKTPAGRYLCRLGDHQLHSGPIRTFEITGVPGHSGILFHPGNIQSDSDGCELVGLSLSLLAGEPFMLKSADTWRALMARQGTEDFWLTVEDKLHA